MPRAPKQTDALGADYTTARGRERGMLRVVLSDGLGEFTGDYLVRMVYAASKFRTEIFLKYGVKLVGWPAGIEFTNPSNMKRPTAKIRALLDAWASGEMRWAWVTQDEYIAGIYDLRSACPGPHFPNPIPRAGRNDIGRRRARAADAQADKYPRRYVRDGAKSVRYVSDEMERGWWPVTRWAEVGMQLLGRGDSDDVEDAGLEPRAAGPALPPRQLHGELPEDPIEYF